MFVLTYHPKAKSLGVFYWNSMPSRKSSTSAAKFRPLHQHVAQGENCAPARIYLWPKLLGLATLFLLIGAIYGPCVNVPFIFDDIGAIVQNESIASLWPLVGASKAGPLNPPIEIPTSARPLVNLSFAVNHAFGGTNPAGYHAVNILIHGLATLILFGLTRRALHLPYFEGRFDKSGDWLALTTAALWSLHPLVTETVIYATQRTESMMALFYLATLYCSLRYWTALAPVTEIPLESDANHIVCHRGSRRFWLVLAGLASLCGMASKEIMVSAPLMVLLFERTFVAGTISAALRRSWPLYLVLGVALLLLAALNINRPHSDTAGFGLEVSAYPWWLTQSKVFFLYLNLIVWPWPLFIHYEFPYLKSFATAWQYVIPLLILGIVTLVLLWRNRPLGYLGTWVFAILSPTFVIPITTEIAAERRMYLALVAPCVLFVVYGYQLSCKAVAKYRSKFGINPDRISAVLCSSIVTVVLLVLCTLDVKRLAAYENEMGLWLEVLSAQPNSSMAHHNVAALLEKNGYDDAAAEHYRAAFASDPSSSHAHYQLGELLNRQGKFAEAATQFAEAIRVTPAKYITAKMHNNLGVALFSAGRNDEAIAAFKAALAADPNDWLTHRNLATALYNAGRYAACADALKAALRLNPQALQLYNELAKSYRKLNEHPKAIAALQQGLELAETAGDTENVNRFSAALKAQQ